MSIVVGVATLGSHAAVVKGSTAGDQSGWSVSGIGDFNGDGFDDIIIGAPLSDAAGASSGAAYLIYGRPGGLGTIDLHNLQASEGFLITGSGLGSFAGESVSGVGDINGDGFDDIAVQEGSLGAFGYGFGLETHIIFGGADNPGAISLNTPPESSFTVSGPFAFYSGSVSDAGDVNGDGFDDFIVTGDFGYGGTFVVFGHAGEFSDMSGAGVLGTDGFAIIDSADNLNNLGESVSSAGDVNGDGFDDIIISADHFGVHNYNSWTAAAFVIFGKENGLGIVNPANFGASDGFELLGISSYGASRFQVSAAGDVNGDGFDDIVIGSTYSLHNPGIAFIVFGKAGGFETVDLESIDGTEGFRVRGSEQENGGGFTVSGAGDVNGDGYDDVLIGEYHADAGGQDSGNAYLIFGHGGAFQNFDIGNSAPYVALTGTAAGDLTGFSVSDAGDVDGDGIDDIIVGAMSADASGRLDAGTTYIIYGQQTGQTAGTGGDDSLFGGFGNDALTGLAGNDYLDGGIGSDSLDGGADNDRIVYDPSDNPAQVSGGTGTDTLLVNDMAAPTAFGLTAHGFEFGERSLRDPGGHDWSSFVERYDSNWQLLSKATFNDNGTNTWTAFDAGDAQSWDQIGFNYDAAGHQVSQDYRYDDGTRSWAALDAYNSQPWSQVWFSYDAAGHKISEDYRYDDGGRSWVAFDGASARPWDHIWFTYDAAGHQTSEDRYNDNGTRIWTAYDANANQAWSQSAFFYDNTGHLYQQIVTWDDGSTSTTSF